MASLGQLLDIDMKPMWMKNLLINDIKERMKHQKLVIQLDFLNLCISKGVAPLEIVKLAKKTGDAKTRFRKFVIFFSKIQIFERFSWKNLI